MRLLFYITVLAVLVSIGFSRADIAISRLFYQSGTGFYLEWQPWVRGIYLAVPYVTKAYVVGLVLAALYFLYKPRKRAWRAWRYLVLVLLIGNVVLIEALCKDYVHRSRPREIVEFGGTMDYVLPLQLGKKRGKSFVSSHAAAGFYVCAFAFLWHGRKRKILYAMGIILGLFIGFLRVMQGGHFLSDIIFAGLIMLWTIHLLAFLLLRKKNHHA